MKTMLDIPDALYREFKAKTATTGEKMRNTVKCFELWEILDPQSEKQQTY